MGRRRVTEMPTYLLSYLVGDEDDREDEEMSDMSDFLDDEPTS